MSVSELFSLIPQTIGQWGPAGIVAVLIIVAERKLKARWEATKGKDHDYMTFLYVGNWIFIALMLLLTTYLYVTKDNGIKVAMKGTIQNIPEQVSVFSNADFYQRRVPRRFSQKTNILWHFTDNTKENATFLLVQKESDLDPTEYFIDPNGDYADQTEIELRYKAEVLEYRNTQNRWVRLASIDEPLRQEGDGLENMDDLESEDDSLVDILINTFISSAYADTVTFEDINTGLHSKNPYTRRDAANYLYDHYQTYLPTMDKMLQDKEIDNNQLWGILTVLTKLSAPVNTTQERTWQLSAPAEKAIFTAAFNEKASIAKQARRYLVRNISEALLTDYETACTQLEKAKPLHQQRCASLGVTLYYQNGINFTKTTKSAEDIQYAVEQMKTKTDLWRFAPESIQVYYGNLFYGIGRVSGNLAISYEQQNNTEAATKARQDAVRFFTQFLSFIKQHSTETKGYRAKTHIQQAECYINTPSIACLETRTKK